MTTEGALVGGRYRLIQPIGRGRSGFVWIAQDGRLHRTVAAKQIPLPRPSSPAMAEEVRAHAAQRARTASTFKHPGAVTVYDVLSEGPDVWVITEYVPSRTMSDFLTGHGKLTTAQVAALGAQLATTLAAAHERSLVHGAVEPSVVQLADDGGVQLTDFAVGAPAQNPAYRSPEVVSGRPATAASDVFSLAATLYLAAEGEPPFGPDGTDIGPPLPRETDELRHALLRMMSGDPALRPTMAGVSQALHAIAAGRKPSPHSLVSATPQPETTRAKSGGAAPLSGQLPASGLAGHTLPSMPTELSVAASPPVATVPGTPVRSGPAHATAQSGAHASANDGAPSQGSSAVLGTTPEQGTSAAQSSTPAPGIPAAQGAPVQNPAVQSTLPVHNTPPPNAPPAHSTPEATLPAMPLPATPVAAQAPTQSPAQPPAQSAAPSHTPSPAQPAAHAAGQPTHTPGSSTPPWPSDLPDRTETHQQGPFTSPIPVQMPSDSPAPPPVWPQHNPRLAQSGGSAPTPHQDEYSTTERALIVTMAVIIAALIGILFTELVLL